jgi:hypothetical protein
VILFLPCRFYKCKRILLPTKLILWSTYSLGHRQESTNIKAGQTRSSERFDDLTKLIKLNHEGTSTGIDDLTNLVNSNHEGISSRINDLTDTINSHHEGTSSVTKQKRFCGQCGDYQRKAFTDYISSLNFNITESDTLSKREEDTGL